MLSSVVVEQVLPLCHGNLAVHALVWLNLQMANDMPVYVVLVRARERAPLPKTVIATLSGTRVKAGHVRIKLNRSRSKHLAVAYLK